jgi:hypothetical protein
MELITLLLAVLATARLTRIITSDYITSVPRRWLLRKLDGREMLQYLVVCNWCASVYVGAAVAVTGWLWAHTAVWTWTTAALAASHVTGWLATREGEA